MAFWISNTQASTFWFLSRLSRLSKSAVTWDSATYPFDAAVETHSPRRIRRGQVNSTATSCEFHYYLRRLPMKQKPTRPSTAVVGSGTPQRPLTEGSTSWPLFANRNVHVPKEPGSGSDLNNVHRRYDVLIRAVHQHLGAASGCQLPIREWTNPAATVFRPKKSVLSPPAGANS